MVTSELLDLRPYHTSDAMPVRDKCFDCIKCYGITEMIRHYDVDGLTCWQFLNTDSWLESDRGVSLGHSILALYKIVCTMTTHSQAMLSYRGVYVLVDIRLPIVELEAVARVQLALNDV